MCMTFLGRTETQNLFLEVRKISEVASKNYSDIQFSVETLCLVDKMIAYTQHKDHIFQAKFAFCLVRDENASTKLWYYFFLKYIKSIDVLY